MEDKMIYQAGNFEVVVIGAGHAGCEAALAAARMGCKTLLCTLSMEHIALMPCNPSIGGPAKAQLVREIDALGGEMAINIDKAQIQMRTINTGKGPAVQALRAQADKQEYYREMLKTLLAQPNLDLLMAEIEDLEIKQGRVSAVITKTGVLSTATLSRLSGPRANSIPEPPAYWLRPDCKQHQIFPYILYPALLPQLSP
jgi:tRNA uridine 5-carboxymethylaminomethyl modification enzyme